MILGKTEIGNGELAEWKNYLNDSLFTLLGQNNTLLPQTPISKDTLDNWNLLDLLTFLKFTRPDTMHHCFESFYPEIRSLAYSEIPEKFSIALNLNWYNRPTMVIYDRIFFDPLEKIQLLALT